MLNSPHRVKLPKSFLAVNLSDAFTFEGAETPAHDKQAPDETADHHGDVAPAEPDIKPTAIATGAGSEEPQVAEKGGD
jgi:hypothetical protein